MSRAVDDAGADAVGEGTWGDWTLYTDPDTGRQYYYNETTGDSVWAYAEGDDPEQDDGSGAATPFSSGGDAATPRSQDEAAGNPVVA